MSSFVLIRNLPTARGRAWASPRVPLRIYYSSQRHLSISSCVLRSRLPVQSTSLLVSSRGDDTLLKRRPSLVARQQRHYSSGKNPWQKSEEWKSALKTGGLVLLGTGALIASTSLAFGFMIAGAAGFGVYTLYQRFCSPFRPHLRSARDPFRNFNSNLETLNEWISRSRQHKQNDLEALVQGMPLLVRGILKTVFAVAGKTLQSSMERAGELRRRTTDALHANQRVREQMGDDVSVGGPEQWVESTVNGVGSIEAVFPVHGASGSAHVTLKASVGRGGEVNLTELHYYHRESGDKIDLLRDSSARGRRKTVIEAEYIDLDKDSRSRG